MNITTGLCVAFGLLMALVSWPLLRHNFEDLDDAQAVARRVQRRQQFVSVLLLPAIAVSVLVQAWMAHWVFGLLFTPMFAGLAYMAWLMRKMLQVTT